MTQLAVILPTWFDNDDDCERMIVMMMKMKIVTIVLKDKRQATTGGDGWWWRTRESPSALFWLQHLSLWLFLSPCLCLFLFWLQHLSQPHPLWLFLSSCLCLSPQDEKRWLWPSRSGNLTRWLWAKVGLVCLDLVRFPIALGIPNPLYDFQLELENLTRLDPLHIYEAQTSFLSLLVDKGYRL